MAETFVMVSCVGEMTAKKSWKEGDFRLVEHLLFVFPSRHNDSFDPQMSSLLTWSFGECILFRDKQLVMIVGFKQVLTFNPLPGATSENVRAGPRAERPKTSGRDR